MFQATRLVGRGVFSSSSVSLSPCAAHSWSIGRSKTGSKSSVIATGPTRAHYPDFSTIELEVDLLTSIGVGWEVRKTYLVPQFSV